MLSLTDGSFPIGRRTLVRSPLHLGGRNCIYGQTRVVFRDRQIEWYKRRCQKTDLADQQADC